MRPRKKNRHLPERVYEKHNAYYYVDRNQKWHRLGEKLSDAMLRWSELVEASQALKTMNEVFNKYLAQVAKKKAKATYETNKVEIANLRKVFGNMLPAAIKSKHVYGYLETRSEDAPIRANREKALLSHIFTYAIKWGIVENNPCVNVKSNPENGRDRAVTDEEFMAVYNVASPFLKAIMWLAYLTGLRQGDLLKIKREDISDKGIYVDIQKTRRKTKTKILIERTKDLDAAIKECEQLNPFENSIYLFCNRRGDPIEATGFRSIWNRTMDKALGHFIFITNQPIFKEDQISIQNHIKIGITVRNRNYYLHCMDNNNLPVKITIYDAELLHRLEDIEVSERKTLVRDPLLQTMIKEFMTANNCELKLFDTKVLEERFTFHDIRRKTATIKDDTEGREAARKLLGHSHQKMTAAYISGVQKVKPVMEVLDKSAHIRQK